MLAAENRGAAGDAVLQPGVVDGGRPGEDRVATLERFVALRTDAVNQVDAALAVLDDSVAFDPTTESIPTSGGVALPVDVERVVKRGRTTGVTRGSISAIEVDNVVVGFAAGNLGFDGQIEMAGEGTVLFSKGGDSGSLVIDDGTGDGVGLLFAGSDQGGPNGVGVTYANPLRAVFEGLAVAGLW